jgi:copper homeostasis protein
MIRPRQGDFVYEDVEVTLMMHDIDAVAAAGLNGVVVGANTETGELDEGVLGKLIKHAKLAGLQITLHRAFDVVPDLSAALTTAQSMGIDSILTSGGALNALQGVDAIRSLVQLAGESPINSGIELMAGVGVSALTAPEIVMRSGVFWLHGSCSMPRSIDSSDAARLGYSLPTHRRTDAGAIDQLRDVLSRLTREAVMLD